MRNWNLKQKRELDSSLMENGIISLTLIFNNFH